MALIAGPRKAVRASGASKKALDDGTFAAVKRDTDPSEVPAHATGCSGDTTAEDAEIEDFTATGRRKRKDTGSVREKARSWSEDEEKLFLASLELHGRALCQIWKHLVNHDGASRQVAHADPRLLYVKL